MRKLRNFLPTAAALILLLGGLFACAPAPSVSTINDPLEAQNRKIHALNKKMDTAFVGPASKAYGSAVPEFALDGIDNFANNISLPGMVVNDLLQLDIEDAALNTFRFAMNTTIGVGGLFDVAGHNGLQEQSTDFGETLHVWGVPEGRYQELPFFGPSTERDTVGLVVDFALDPVSLLVPAPEKYIGTGAKLLGKFSSRHRFSGFVDSVLYESEDSYAQSRLLYLQSRRRDLQGELTDADLEDPYAE